MRIFYVNINKKRLVGRCNQQNVLPLQLEYDIIEELSFQFIDDVNQIQDISNLHGLTLAIGKHQGKPSYDLLALSKDYVIENNILTFKVNTYTSNWINEIKKSNTEVYFEISQDFEEQKKVLARDYCYAWPRVFVEGLSPEVIVDDYYTKEEVNAKIEEAVSGLVPPSGDAYATEGYVNEAISGLASQEYVDTGLEKKQSLINEDNKLAYDLLSGTPTIPTKTSDIQNDSDFITSTDVADAISGKADITDIPLSTSQLTNDSGFITDSALNGFATETYVTDAISGKADTSTLTSHTSDTAIHVTSTDKTNWNAKLDSNALNVYATEAYVQGQISGKQDKITSDNKLDYSLISSTPTIPTVPTNVGDFTNDVSYQTASDVEAAVSGKQDLITTDNKLDYALISGAPSIQNAEWGAITGTLSSQTDLQNALNQKANSTDIPLSTSQLTNDSNFVNQTTLDTALSGKQNIITNDNKLNYYLISGTPTIPLSTSQLTNDSDFQTSTDVASAISGKQNLITADNKLDYSLLSGTPSIPLSTSELVNDSDFATSSYINTQITSATSGKLDKVDYVTPYRLPYNTGVNSWLEEDIGVTLQWSDQDIIPNDRKVVIVAYSNNGDDHLVFPTLIAHANENVIKTCEIWVKMAGNTTEAQGITSIVIPSSYYIVDESNFPTKLKGEAINSEAYTYHIFIIRAIPRQLGTFCEVGYSHFINTNISI